MAWRMLGGQEHVDHEETTDDEFDPWTTPPSMWTRGGRVPDVQSSVATYESEDVDEFACMDDEFVNTDDEFDPWATPPSMWTRGGRVPDVQSSVATYEIEDVDELACTDDEFVNTDHEFDPSPSAWTRGGCNHVGSGENDDGGDEDFANPDDEFDPSPSARFRRRRVPGGRHADVVIHPITVASWRVFRL